MKYTTETNTIKIILYTLLAISLVATYLFFMQIQKEYLAITTFTECVDAGYPVLATYPEQCKIPGKTFTNTTQVKETDTKEIATPVPEKNMNPKNTSYDIEGDHILLENAESTLTDKKVKYFGNELRIDIDGDAKEDTAFILTVKTSGTGTFYYLVAALNKDGGYIGTNGVLLGDRIAPQTTEWKNSELVVNYAERKIDEPMTAKPSVGVSRYFKIENNTLVEIQK